MMWQVSWRWLDMVLQLMLFKFLKDDFKLKFYFNVRSFYAWLFFRGGFISAHIPTIHFLWLCPCTRCVCVCVCVREQSSLSPPNVMVITLIKLHHVIIMALYMPMLCWVLMSAHRCEKNIFSAVVSVCFTDRWGVRACERDRWEMYTVIVNN